MTGSRDTYMKEGDALEDMIRVGSADEVIDRI